MSDLAHFEFGSQPQDRAALHQQLLADPEWVDKGHDQLETELGEQIIGALGSLTMLLARKPDAKLDEHAVEFTSTTTESQSNIVIVPLTVLQTTGLDLEKLAGWNRRVKESTEDRPMRFDILGQGHGAESDPAALATVWFDGTHYGIARNGRRFEYPVKAGEPIQSFFTDAWSVWDYNAEKRRQRIAERDNIVLSAEGLILDLDNSQNAEDISRILCTAGMLHSSSFILGEQARIASSTGRSYEDIGWQEILVHKAQGEYDGIRIDYFDVLDRLTEGMDDQTQLALARFWFVTEGQRELVRHDIKDRAGALSILEELLTAEVERTQGAANWDAATIRVYLLSVLDRVAESFTEAITEDFGGHRFAHAQATGELLAETEYPELNQYRRYMDLGNAVGLAQNPPPYELLERLRELERLQEDLGQAYIDQDNNRAEFLEGEIVRIQNATSEKYDPYLTVVNAAAEGAMVEIDDSLGIEHGYNTRAMVIEGILLAKEIARRADDA